MNFVPPKMFTSKGILPLEGDSGDEEAVITEPLTREELVVKALLHHQTAITQYHLSIASRLQGKSPVTTELMQID